MDDMGGALMAVAMMSILVKRKNRSPEEQAAQRTKDAGRDAARKEQEKLEAHDEVKRQHEEMLRSPRAYRRRAKKLLTESKGGK